MHPAEGSRLVALFPDQSLEFIIGAESRQPPPITEVGRDGGDAHIRGPLPVGIDRRGKAPLVKDLPCFTGGKPDGAGYPQELVNQGNVAAIDEIGLVDGPAKRVSLAP